ncbi:MAG: hypothetical protein CM1200mP20_04770 [Pseudomonadota bacterium]|nr:MAG: hypothetical protein CM1200mP20_04770 [Pseudomonadota bacterium]
MDSPTVVPLGLWDVDIRRALSFQSNMVSCMTGPPNLLAFCTPCTGRSGSQKPPGHSPTPSTTGLRGQACFGEAGGWERPNWFAPAGVDPEYDHTYAKPKWLDYSALEHQTVREQVGLLDISTFSKFLLQGRDAGKNYQPRSAKTCRCPRAASFIPSG